MMRPGVRIPLLGVLGVAALAVSLTRAMPGHAQKAAAESPAAEQARKTVRMLDHIYKTAIVLITERYVQDKKDYPAGRAAIKWFEAITKQGSHEVRLLDVSGQPYSDKNVARDDFEKDAVKQLQAGKDYVERIETQGGKKTLRAMTAVPVVMQKCIMCHPNYADAKPGAAVGALSYSIPLE